MSSTSGSTPPFAADYLAPPPRGVAAGDPETSLWAAWFEEADASARQGVRRADRRARVRSSLGPILAPLGPPASRAAARLRGADRRRITLAALVVLAVLGLAAGVVAALAAALSSPAPASTTAAAAHRNVAAAPVVSSWCPQSVTDQGVVTTSGAGDTASGAGVIAALEHAYYTVRSGVAARAFAAPGSSLPDAATIQHAIDAVPAGTTYCLTITPQGGGMYGLAVDERRPGVAEQTWNDTVRVADTGGRFSVVSLITAGQ